MWELVGTSGILWLELGRLVVPDFEGSWKLDSVGSIHFEKSGHDIGIPLILSMVEMGWPFCKYSGAQREGRL